LEHGFSEGLAVNATQATVCGLHFCRGGPNASGSAKLWLNSEKFKSNKVFSKKCSLLFQVYWNKEIDNFKKMWYQKYAL
jgi:hypothetical protein